MEDVFPLTAMQHGILFHCLMQSNFDETGGEKNSSAATDGVLTNMYVQQSVFRMHGVLHVPRFRRAWAAVLGKHPVLRSYADVDFLTPEGRPALVTIASANTVVPLHVIDEIAGTKPMRSISTFDKFTSRLTFVTRVRSMKQCRKMV